MFQEENNDHEEEEMSFWIFAMLVESLVPIDFYSNIVGALIDQNVF
jgi:hypothetical protein